MILVKWQWNGNTFNVLMRYPPMNDLIWLAIRLLASVKHHVLGLIALRNFSFAGIMNGGTVKGILIVYDERRYLWQPGFSGSQILMQLSLTSGPFVRH